MLINFILFPTNELMIAPRAQMSSASYANNRLQILFCHCRFGACVHCTPTHHAPFRHAPTPNTLRGVLRSRTFAPLRYFAASVRQRDERPPPFIPKIRARGSRSLRARPSVRGASTGPAIARSRRASATSRHLTFKPGFHPVEALPVSLHYSAV